jgi:hypothetical protein
LLLCDRRRRQPGNYHDAENGCCAHSRRGSG